MNKHRYSQAIPILQTNNNGRDGVSKSSLIQRCILSLVIDLLGFQELLELITRAKAFKELLTEFSY
jgi:hypothetical protein